MSVPTSSMRSIGRRKVRRRDVAGFAGNVGAPAARKGANGVLGLGAGAWAVERGPEIEVEAAVAGALTSGRPGLDGGGMHHSAPQLPQTAGIGAAIDSEAGLAPASAPAEWADAGHRRHERLGEGKQWIGGRHGPTFGIEPAAITV